MQCSEVMRILTQILRQRDQMVRRAIPQGAARLLAATDKTKEEHMPKDPREREQRK